jgi:hypothetical protein
MTAKSNLIHRLIRTLKRWLGITGRVERRNDCRDTEPCDGGVFAI